MTKDNPFVGRQQSIRLGTLLMTLSIFLPYLVGYRGPESLSGTFMIYAPIWVLQERVGILYGGPSIIALTMFQFWIPYTLIGFQAYRYASGQLSSERRYFQSVVLLMVIAILFVIPMSLMPSGFDGDGAIYSPYIPIPIIPILALVSYRKLRPIRVETPWAEGSTTEDTTSDEESVWNE